MPDPRDPPLNMTHPDGSSAADGVNPIIEALGMEARIMLKGVRLPEDGDLSAMQRDEVRRIVNEHMEKHRVNKRGVATQLGISPSTVSEVLSGAYEARANPDLILRKLNAWIDADELRRRQETPLGTYNTNILQSVFKAAAIAKKAARVDHGRREASDEDSRIVLCHGPSGCGKTIAGMALHADDPNSIFIRIGQRGGTDFGVARAIITAESWHARQGGAASLTFVQDKLRDSGRLLIIDQAHRLARSGYEFLIDLVDVCGIPILLLGTNVVSSRVDRQRLGNGTDRDEQYARRVGHVVNLILGSDGGGGTNRPIFTLEEVVAIFHSDRVRLTEDGAEFLQAIACLPRLGSLGMARNIFKKAVIAAARRKRDVDALLLRDATQTVNFAPGVKIDELIRKLETQVNVNRKLNAIPQPKVAAG